MAESTIDELDTESLISECDSEYSILSSASEIDELTANERKQVVKQLAYGLMNMGLMDNVKL